jgi:hypothetical protein
VFSQKGDQKHDILVFEFDVGINDNESKISSFP